MAVRSRLVDRVKNLKLYGLLGVEPDAEEKLIIEVGRKKILSVLPYKNRKNEGAEDQFQQLSDALNVLTDEKTRAAYDNLLWLTELTNKQIKDRLKVLKTNQEVRKRKVTSEERKIRKN